MREAKGRACEFNLFFLIPLGGNQLWKAKARAIGDADGLIDLSVDSSIGFAVIGTTACTEVRGTRYRLLRQPGTAVDPEPIVDPAMALPADATTVAPPVESESAAAPTAPPTDEVAPAP